MEESFGTATTEQSPVGPSSGLEVVLVEESELIRKGQVVGEPHLQLLSTFLAENEVVESMIAEVAVDGVSHHEDAADGHQVQDTANNVEQCCNCSGSLDANEGTFKGLNENITCNFFNVGLKRLAVGTIKIKDVLRVMCQVESFEDEGELSRSDLEMCGKCIDKLTRVYELYNEFMSISVRYDSVFSKFTKTIVDLLQKEINITSESLNESVGEVNTATVTQKLENQSFNAIEKTFVINEKMKEKKNVNQSVRSNTFKSYSDKVKTKSKVVSVRTSQSSQPVKPDLDIVPSFENGIIQTKIIQNNTKVENTSDLLEAFITFDSNGTPSDTCLRCGKRFKTFGGLKIHYASHVRDDNKIACKDCGKKFNKPEALEMHQRIDHKGFKPHQCPHDGCTRSFRLKDKLKLHIKVMHEKNKPFPCPKCEKAFRTKYHLKAHDVAQHVQGDSTIGCTQCRRKFPTKDALQMHVKTHEEEKRFICSQCYKGFKTASRLKLHEKSHDAVPSAVCATCGKAYKHARDLRLHEVIHEEESSYRFACGDCPRKFYRIDLLRVHQANEKHFSQEIVGPCVTKPNSPGKMIKDKAERNKNTELNPDIDNSGQTSEKSSSKRKRKQKPKIEEEEASLKNKEPLYDCLGSPSLFPSMVPGDSMDDSSHGLEIVELAPSLTNTAISTSLFRRNTQEIDCAEHSSFMSNSKDPVITNLVSTSNAGLTLPVASMSSYSLPGNVQGNGNAIYTIKDASDRNISSFSISAGAEQIGYDVINAFINNLN